jgi:hypothetical protein
MNCGLIRRDGGLPIVGLAEADHTVCGNCVVRISGEPE